MTADRERHHAAVARRALSVGYVAQLFHDQPRAAFVVLSRPAVAGRSDARLAAERVDLQARIVGNDRQLGPRRVRLGLQPRVRLEGVAGLLDLAAVGQRVQAEHLDPLGLQRGPELAQLPGIRGRDDQALHVRGRLTPSRW